MGEGGNSGDGNSGDDISGDGKRRESGVNGEDVGVKLLCCACSSGTMSASVKMVKMVASEACAKRSQNSCWMIIRFLGFLMFGGDRGGILKLYPSQWAPK